MRHPYLGSLSALVAVLALVWLAPNPIAGQTPAAARPTTTAKALRTPWGDPDLQGVWHVTANVPLERAAEYAGKEFLTDAEVAALDAKKAENQGRNTRAAGGTAQ